MITSNDCWLKDKCYKYNHNEDCECKNDDIYCVKLFKINELYRNSLLSEAQFKRPSLIAGDVDKESFEKLIDIENSIEDFVVNGKNLYIHSMTTGNGKTSWAIRLLQDYINAVWYRANIDCKTLFINIPRFLLALKSSISQNSEYIDFIKENIYNADLVVWDEVGSKIATEFESENLYAMIDGRIDLGKSNIYTSNISPDELKTKVGDRLYSRIVNLSENIELKENDKRSLVK